MHLPVTSLRCSPRGYACYSAVFNNKQGKGTFDKSVEVLDVGTWSPSLGIAPSASSLSLVALSR